MTKREWDALGTLLLPVEMGGKRTLGPKMAERLMDEGYVRPFERALYATGERPSVLSRLPVIIRGYEMTARGHFAYCDWASRQSQDEEAANDEF